MLPTDPAPPEVARHGRWRPPAGTAPADGNEIDDREHRHLQGDAPKQIAGDKRGVADRSGGNRRGDFGKRRGDAEQDDAEHNATEVSAFRDSVRIRCEACPCRIGHGRCSDENRPVHPRRQNVERHAAVVPAQFRSGCCNAASATPARAPCRRGRSARSSRGLAMPAVQPLGIHRGRVGIPYARSPLARHIHEMSSVEP